MLTKKQVTSAIHHNAGKLGSLYELKDLPWPWCLSDSKTFIWATACFQMSKNLEVDGKLGPVTLKAIKKSEDDTSVETPKKPSPDLDPPPYGKPNEHGYSNAIIVNGERVTLPKGFIDAGLTASNYEDDGEPHFKHRQRSADLIHFVLHETCGNTAKGCKRTLLKKGYGVQLILDPDGHLSCHGDLVLDRMVHANQINDTSIGVEIVNPYAPKYVRDESIWSKFIKALWWTWCPDKKDRRYVLPTDRQMAAIRLLVPWICKLTGIPFRFPTKGLNKKKRQIEGLTMKPKGRPGPGIVAHRDFASHSDGRYVLNDFINRV